MVYVVTYAHWNRRIHQVSTRNQLNGISKLWDNQFQGRPIRCGRQRNAHSSVKCQQREQNPREHRIISTVIAELHEVQPQDDHHQPHRKGIREIGELRPKFGRAIQVEQRNWGNRLLMMQLPCRMHTEQTIGQDIVGAVAYEIQRQTHKLIRYSTSQKKRFIHQQPQSTNRNGHNRTPMDQAGIAKPDGSPRHIAIGSLLRRSAGAILLKRHADKIQSFVGPNQFGINVKAGIELFVHGLKAILQHIRPIEDAVAIKVDFKNAFNACKRSKLLDLIRRHIPELYGYVKGCYASQVTLFLPNGSIIQSCSVVHQGDPLGGSMFAIVLADALKSALTCIDNIYHAAYHDDLTMASLSSATIILALTSLEALKDNHEIQINYAKTEWISNLSRAHPSQFIGITHNTTFDTSLVSIPIGRTTHINEEMDGRQKEWASQFDKIIALRHSQTMLLLLRGSMQMAKTMEAITAHPITSQQWLQCQLPIRHGGLGLKTALPYTGAAFIASVLAASKLLLSIHKSVKNVNWIPTIEMDNAIHDYNTQARSR
ncbi:hypothetical protein RFI_04372 [Reticulomyxa filosa]|uniref:Reverse transcriptase domain-containing protein n=1 Tax=Reticulomyxa filosa TaxID=46433 RepID=X6P3S8_RETFI|nr:hypothetical protein RFI_04372 [Reticulomyxa filosa]|eukprot:ETO32744.1 hypothetical protein RFI_04372 [Reticulomyxa filosa]